VNRAALKVQLVRHEGLKLHPYRDTVGKVTIGVGRNLDDVGISEAEAHAMLDADIDRTERALFAALPWVADLDDARQVVLMNMAFNLGVGMAGGNKGLLGFPYTLGLIQAGRFEEAAKAMLDSKWARQVGKRATELAQIMATAPRKAA
jgi:lysozyme